MEDSPSEADRAKGAVVGPTFQCIIGGGDNARRSGLEDEQNKFILLPPV